ncbi:hypothetical protein KBY65_09045 [Cyanobium sp. Alchichica 3B3-8F6]|uniref:hypothetical protein n=1 Tax=Cyanobium sp. Alchichica 3B3-8F6 TaxID=2823696 RepID=UPI0020CD8A83|nr:hypothetical protein [Cyanobium sp. Alchichica 3B3-8F6]MCP9882626.1 hypothetical protein [Cyanobium sp. Alchichica 3B3-8F6]
MSDTLHRDEGQRIRDALRYQARELHHRSFAVHSSRRDLLWEEMDRCLALADRVEQHWLRPDS